MCKSIWFYTVMVNLSLFASQLPTHGNISHTVAKPNQHLHKACWCPSAIWNIIQVYLTYGPDSKVTLAYSRGEKSPLKLHFWVLLQKDKQQVLPNTWKNSTITEIILAGTTVFSKFRGPLWLIENPRRGRNTVVIHVLMGLVRQSVQQAEEARMVQMAQKIL